MSSTRCVVADMAVNCTEEPRLAWTTLRVHTPRPAVSVRAKVMEKPDANQPAPGAGHSLRQVQAAQLRAKAIRWGIGKSIFGIVFLIGALAYALGPDRNTQSSRMWMALLVILSTFNVGLGLRTFSRVRNKARRVWIVATILWGALATGLVRILLTR
jgi:hypothetical protein